MSKNVLPVFGMNKYLWAQIVANGIITGTSNYNGLVPIIPVQEEPQFISAMEAQSGIGSAPYIVYQTYTNGITADSWYKQTDTVIYQINALDSKLLRQLFLLTVDIFKRYDDSAEPVNDYIDLAFPLPDDPQNPGSKVPDGPDVFGYEYRCLHYNFIYVASANAGQPVNVENDPTKATITLRVNYTDTRNDTKLVVPPIV